MVSDDSAQWRRPEDMVAVLTRGGVVWSQGQPRVTHSRPCAIGPTGVTLHRWPLRSIFIPLERVDRFDVVLAEGPLDWLKSDEWAHGTNDLTERLAVLTRDGQKLLVSGLLSAMLSGWHGLPLRSRAQQLNNHVLPTWRAARSSDSDPPPTGT
jgi:hypothetical protein